MFGVITFMSDYQIRFFPQLAINPNDFVVAWNSIANCRDVAKIHVNKVAAMDFDSSTAKALTLPRTIAIGVTTNTIYDLIKNTVINLPTVQKTLATQTGTLHYLKKNLNFVD